jgi:hypothetical protein
MPMMPNNVGKKMLLFPPWGCQDDYEVGFLTEKAKAAPGRVGRGFRVR